MSTALLCRHCWECLGDAYLARGSYNSALRTFKKALEVSFNSAVPYVLS